MNTQEEALTQRLGKQNVEIALRLGADLAKDNRFLPELITEANGRKDEGLLVRCFDHTTENGRCRVLMTKRWAYHIYEDGDVRQEPIKEFHLRALDYLAPGRTSARIVADVESRPDVEWLWHGLIRPGSLTLLVAQSGIGKSTLLFDLFTAIGLAEALEGTGTATEFLGLPVLPTSVLYFSEEDDEAIVEKIKMRTLVHRTPLIRYETIPYVRPDSDEVWAKIDQAIEEFPPLPGLEQRPLLVIIDSLNHFLPITDQDDPYQAHAALMPLQKKARERRIAGLVLHHVPKRTTGAKADPILAVRGSSAFAAAADVVVAMFKPTTFTTQRLLRCLGRYKDTPKPGEPIYMEYSDVGGYVRVEKLSEEAPTDSMSAHLSGTPVPPSSAPLDDVHRQIIKLRSRRPRPSVREVAKTVGRKAAWVGQEIKALVAEGVLSK